MTDLQLITLIVTLLAIFAAMYGNRKSVEDMRDVLRAEIKAVSSASSLELRDVVTPINLALQRIENKLDHVTETQATHSEAIAELKRRS
jgi:hypothetical protein